MLLTATRNVLLATIDAESGDVYVIADSDDGGGGSIIDNLAGEGTNVTAASASLRAATGIGVGVIGDVGDIDTLVARIAARTDSGDINLENNPENTAPPALGLDDWHGVRHIVSQIRNR